MTSYEKNLWVMIMFMGMIDPPSQFLNSSLTKTLFCSAHSLILRVTTWIMYPTKLLHLWNVKVPLFILQQELLSFQSLRSATPTTLVVFFLLIPLDSYCHRPLSCIYFSSELSSIFMCFSYFWSSLFCVI